jgi:hypothetical protein
MTRTRRGIALLATFAVLATALWPLVSSWAASMRHEPVPLCHQAGMQVAADSMPMPASPDEKGAPQSHCPLCVLVFFAAFAPTVAPPPYVALVMAVVQQYLPALPARRFTVVLPGSRAPPQIIA